MPYSRLAPRLIWDMAVVRATTADTRATTRAGAVSVWPSCGEGGVRRICESEAPGVSSRTACWSASRMEEASHALLNPMAVMSRGRAGSASWRPEALQWENPSPSRNLRGKPREESSSRPG